MKYFWIAATILLFFFSGPAQAKSRLLIGVRAGPMAADANIGNSSSDLPYDPKAGLIFGGSLEWIAESATWRLPPGIRLDAFIVKKGWKDRQGSDPWGARQYRTLGFVSIEELVISPLVTLRFSRSKSSPYLLIGPEVGFHLSAEEKMNYSGGERRVEPFAWRTSPNCGINFGAGLTERLWQGFASAELRYNWGLTNMTDPYRSNVSSIRTNGLQLLLGYSFDMTERQ
jgi:hypothetical protein